MTCQAVEELQSFSESLNPQVIIREHPPSDRTRIALDI